MAAYDFSSQRLFVESGIAEGLEIALDKAQTNYLCNVLRLSEGASLLIFNGRDGEWRARLGQAGRKSFFLLAEEKTREQAAPNDLHYIFAPLKQARLDYIVQKAVEMGASRIQPVFTRRTQAERVNEQRMRANVIEAAEQCGILNIADIAPPLRFDLFLRGYDRERLLIFCDEDAEVSDPLTALDVKAAVSLAVLIGPEGGFDPAEREKLLALPNVIRLSLGPRILRADTAAVAALALVQAKLGDWRGSSRGKLRSFPVTR